MAGCELNIAHAFVATPTAHRLRHDVIVTSADDFEGSRRRRCVDDDDDTETDRGGMIPHYRLVPSAFGPAGGGEWVTLSKSVLLQLVERICQLSFQTDALPTAAVAAAAAATCSSASQPTDVETLAEISMDATEAPPSIAAERFTPPSPSTPSTNTSTSEVEATVASASENVVEISNGENSELTAEVQVDADDIPASDAALVASSDVVPSQELNVDEPLEETNRDSNTDEDDSEVFAESEVMQEGDTTENSSSLPEEPSPSTPDDAVAVPTVTRKLPSSSTALRSTSSLRADRRRRLRELRRLRRHRHTADDQLHDRRRDLVVRRRFAVPRQPPPRLHIHHDVEPDAVDASSPVGLPIRCRLFQPWSALNKLVICQLVDVVLSQELTTTTTTWRSATTTPSEKRRSSGTIWNPAVTPDTRESHTPPPLLQLSPSVSDFTSLASPTSNEPGSSTLLHSLLSPMAIVDRRRSDSSAVDSLAWTMSQSLPLRRRHHSAVAPDTFHAAWTPPSFFWYNVPPSQGNLFLLPDVACPSPCYQWISPTPPISLSRPTSDAAAALDYSSRTLDTDGCPDSERHESGEHRGPPRRRGSRPSSPPRRRSSARLKWVVVNKTDVCSLFESLASSMVTDGDQKRTALESSDHPTTPCTDKGSVGAEPIKWKSTLLRRARAEAETPKRSGSDDDVVQKAHDSFPDK